MYSENFGFGLRGFILSRTFNNRMKGLVDPKRCQEAWPMAFPAATAAWNNARLSGAIWCQPARRQKYLVFNMSGAMSEVSLPTLLTN